jgi:uncharacterized membrane protein
MPDVEKLMQALVLLAFLLYLVPAAVGTGLSARGRSWFQRGAILMLATAAVIAVGATVAWFAQA